MTPEHLLMNQIRLWCGQHGYPVIRLNSGKAWAGKVVDTPEYGRVVLNPKAVELCQEGTSDLMVILPNKIAFIETKIHPRKPTKDQLNFIAKMTALGHIAGVVYSLDEFVDLLIINRVF